MPTNIQPALLAPMPFSDGAGAPAEFTLIRFGTTEYTKGRDDGSFQFDDKDADRIIADFAKRGKELVIDYDHATASVRGMDSSRPFPPSHRPLHSVEMRRLSPLQRMLPRPKPNAGPKRRQLPYM